MEVFGYVYRTTNLINSKTYIGQRRLSADKNKGWGFYLGSGKNILNAIEKYGKNNFKKELICYAKNQEELDELETKAIKEEMNTLGKNCYNLFPGATSAHYPLRNISKEDLKKKISNSVRQSDKVKKAKEKSVKELTEKYNAIMYSQKQKIIEHYIESNTIIKTAKHFNIPTYRLRNFLVENKIQINGKPRTEKAKRNISKGISLSDKRNSATIYNRKCFACGKEFETKVKHRETCSMTCGRKATGLKQKISLDNNKIKEMYVGGMSLTKIAKLLGVSFSTINNRLKEMGVERRNNQN